MILPSYTDLDWLRLAFTNAAEHSHDPSTQNGAVLVPRGPSYASPAANEFPINIFRTPERLTRPNKYRWIEHAERNAIYAAARMGTATAGATLYCCWFACPDCARGIIQAGIKEVVGHVLPRSLTPPRWEAEVAFGEAMLREAGVSMRWLAGDMGVTILFDGQRVAV
jgi:dCMP deaminase